MISLIAAMAENGVIGHDGDLPWRLPADLAHFKQLTTGHPIVMGRKTYESIGRPLPNRRNIVLTRDRSWSPGGEAAGKVECVYGWDELTDRLSESDDEVFVIGGEAIYRLALPRADRVYLTRVHANVEGDVHFPPLTEDRWELVEQTHRPADEKNEHAMTFCRYERRRG